MGFFIFLTSCNFEYKEKECPIAVNNIEIRLYEGLDIIDSYNNAISITEVYSPSNDYRRFKLILLDVYCSGTYEKYVDGVELIK